MTGRGQANVLTRATSILAALFFVTSLGLTLFAKPNGRTGQFSRVRLPLAHRPHEGTVLQQLQKEQQQRAQQPPGPPAQPEPPRSQ